jgi:hypothetical protein
MTTCPLLVIGPGSRPQATERITRRSEGPRHLRRLATASGISTEVHDLQFEVFDRFYPVEAVLLLLAVLPYFVFRWLVEHAARWWLG